jgi:hypothetical protein
MTIQVHEAALKWRKIKASKEQIEADLMRLLSNPDATDDQVLKAKELYKGVCSMYLDTKELLCIEFPMVVAGPITYPWHIRG